MASSYTTNFGIEEMATGDQSGDWGTTTNFNFDILDRITAYKAVALSDASTATLTVREASPGSGTENLQDGMFRVIKFTGSLSQNCTITIAPNTTTAFFVFIDGTSGGFSLIFSQGSGANYTLASGTRALVYCDGAGSGAVVAPALVEPLTTRGDIVVRNASNLTARLAVGSANYVVLTDGTDVAWGQVSLTAGVTGTLPTGNGGTGSTSTTYCALGTNVSGTLPVANGVTGATSLTDGGVLLGSGTGAVTALAVLADSEMIVGNGSTDPVAESGATLRTSIGVGTGDSPQFAAVDIVGDATAATFKPDGDTSASDTAAIGYTSAEGLILTGQGSTNDVTIKNDADGEVCGVPTGTDDLRFPDNAKTEWGTGGDLQIYHDASNSYINDTGTGNLKLAASQIDLLGGTDGGETMATFADDGAVTLYHDNTSTLATSATGVSITGTLIATTDTDTSNTGSVTLDFGANQNFVLTFTGNVTLANPSTEQVGQSGIIVCIQDGTGSRTLSLGTDYETAGGAGITLSTAASAVDIIPYFVKAAGSIQLGAVQLAFA